MSENEKRLQIPVRLPESLSRRFKAACAWEGISGQEFFERTAERFADHFEKKIAEKNKPE